MDSKINQQRIPDSPTHHVRVRVV